MSNKELIDNELIDKEGVRASDSSVYLDDVSSYADDPSARASEPSSHADLSPLIQRIITAFSVILLIGISVFVLLQSPLSPGSIQYPDAESSLYLYTGLQLFDGNMPYRDVFDFHGPLIFLIDALGLFIGGSSGVWVIEVHVLIVTLLLVFFMLRRSTDPITALLVCLILVMLVGYSLQGGNQIEEYTLLFQALALVGFVDYLIRRRLTLLSVYLIGISGALTFCIKPALTVFWVPFIVVIFFLLLKREGLGIAVTRLITILFSASLVFIILVPWLYVNNALTSCLEQITSYYQDYLSLATRQEQTNALLYFVDRPFVLLITFISLAAIVRLLWLRYRAMIERKGRMAAQAAQVTAQATERAPSTTAQALPPTTVRTVPLLEDTPFGRHTLLLIVTNLIAALLVFLTMAIPGQQDENVVLQGLICLAIPLAYILHFFMRGIFSRERLRIMLGAVLVVLLGLSLGVPGFTETASRVREQREESPELVQQQELVAEVRNQQGYDEPIIVFGDDCWIYIAAGSYSATRYAYQPFDLGFDPGLDADFYRQIKVAESTLLVGRTNEGLVERYPGISEYERIFKNQYYEVYRRIEPDVNEEDANQVE
jgi:hypothetical protein